jgi:hypothetical protein
MRYVVWEWEWEWEWESKYGYSINTSLKRKKSDGSEMIDDRLGKKYL